jgi:hypothetical protein
MDPTRREFGFGASVSTALVLLGSFCGAGAAAVDEPEPPVTGFVAELSGSWQRVGEPGEPLLLGTALPGGSSVRALSPEDPDSRIRIVLLDGHSVVLSCSILGACRTDLELPAATREPSSLSRRLLEAAKRLHTDPTRYVPIASRGGALREAIVGIERDGLDLRAAGVGVPVRRQTLYMRPAREIGNEPYATLRLTLDAESTLAAPASAVSPGLYEVTTELVHERADLPWPDSAWILAVLPQQKREFDRGLERAAGLWSEGKSAARDAERPLLRAYLAALWQEHENRKERLRTGTP